VQICTLFSTHLRAPGKKCARYTNSFYHHFLSQCPQLLYRLQHGELVNCPDYESPVIWVLIGTNDQSDHCSPESILIGILHIANYLQEQRPNARIVLNSILPKPNPTSREWTSQTNKYYDPVTWINQRLACYAQGAAPNVEYFDSSWLFVTPDDGLVPEDLMPDGLHPSGKGARIWGEAILKRVEEIVEEQQKAAAQVPES
jgi:lysophospholipase L1-like esterase